MVVAHMMVAHMMVAHRFSCRGNQRDTDRARAAARAAKGGGVTAKDKDGLTASQRKER